jgi:REP element-mobilizing transposase RayT
MRAAHPSQPTQETAMTQSPRWTPAPDSSQGRPLVEVTTCTFQHRYFLKPTPEVWEIIVGILGRAQRIYGMDICLAVFASSHWHGLLRPTDAGQLARFMNYVNGEIPRKILPLVNKGRRKKWKGKFWDKPYDAIVVSDEPAAQLARFEYLLAHGVKENLVERPEQWIGVNGVLAWLEGKPLEGHWFDKTREYREKRLKRSQGKVFDRLHFAKREVVQFGPLPCWEAEGLSLEEIRAQIREMIERIVEKARVERKAKKIKRVLGTKAVLSKPWGFEPAEEPEERPRPLFHFRSREHFDRLWEAYSAFLADYRRASAEYRSGKKGVRFPERCFPPARPFTFDGRVDGTGVEGPEM